MDGWRSGSPSRRCRRSGRERSRRADPGVSSGRASGRGAAAAAGTRSGARGAGGGRRFANAFSSGWTTWLAGAPISDSQCGYRLYSRVMIQGTPITGGGYELETAIAVRAARLGFRVAEVEIPTIYSEAGSQIRPLRDVPRIVGALGRLTLERMAPGPAMRRAARARA